jgi:ATP-dependent DNA helicase PIF1
MPTYTPLTIDPELALPLPAALRDTRGVRTRVRTSLPESIELDQRDQSQPDQSQPDQQHAPQAVVASRPGERPATTLLLDPDPPAPQAEAEAEIAAPQAADLWSPCPTFTYLAGPAGSGKTFWTKAWAARAPGLELCATTGIAAINLGGTTINALLGYFDTRSLMENYTSGMLGARLGRLWKAGVRRLVIDEVSMLDGDQLTYLVRAINEVNGRGYVLASADDDEDTPPAALGLTLVGDFAQLPPVKAPFAFESPEWRQATDGSGDGGARFAEATITLREIRRQADPDFIHALRAARIGDGATAAAYFAATGRFHATADDRFAGPTLLAKNEAVDRYNWLRLDKLPGRAMIFPSTRWGKQRSEWGNPEKPPHTWGIPLRLSLKEGALVMILANHWTDGPNRSLIYVNGDLGELVSANETDHTAEVRLQRTGAVVEVEYVRREVKQPCDAARRKELRAEGKDDLISDDGKWEITGWIDYMPLRVAYASTVHKSQGLSLDQVQINFRDAFFKSAGMVYVALSRARTAAGLRLVGTPATLVERCHADPRLKEWL